MNLTENRNKFIIVTVIIAAILLVILLVSFMAVFRKNPRPNNIPDTPSTKIDPQKFLPPQAVKEQEPKRARDIRQEIILSASDKNGDKVVFSSANYRIIYVPTPDVFFVQIFKDPADSYRREAQSWFIQKGLTQSDLCNLPVRILLFDPGLKKTNPNFNYFPDGC